MKASIRLFLAIFLLFSLTACWGDEDADGDNSTNKNTAIDLGRPATFTGKYNIEFYEEKFEDETISSENSDSFKGEVTIKSGSIPTTLESSFKYVKDGQTKTTARDFKLTVGDSGKLGIDGTQIIPAAKEVYAFTLGSDKYYLIIKVDGLTQDGSNKKYDLRIEAEKISNDPEYKKK